MTDAEWLVVQRTRIEPFKRFKGLPDIIMADIKLQAVEMAIGDIIALRFLRWLFSDEPDDGSKADMILGRDLSNTDTPNMKRAVIDGADRSYEVFVDMISKPLEDMPLYMSSKDRIPYSVSRYRLSNGL